MSDLPGRSGGGRRMKEHTERRTKTSVWVCQKGHRERRYPGDVVMPVMCCTCGFKYEMTEVVDVQPVGLDSLPKVPEVETPVEDGEKGDLLGLFDPVGESVSTVDKPVSVGTGKDAVHQITPAHPDQAEGGWGDDEFTVENTAALSFSDRYVSPEDLAVVGRPGSQCRMVFEWLLQHGTISHSQAEEHLKYLTVIRSRASDLKRRLPKIGYAIVPDYIPNKSGKSTHAVYHLRRILTDWQRFRVRIGARRTA